ncbi:transketolase family protein [Natranaerofaba carboxydovora]|uniref:transketolase family protein n=1 Tax=Natranaerofaba carboxydovora TaxID=2742683 RepID=UPI001F13E957|nr:transketolase family protein [Natranaerofaba carboxydovora]UMZ74942.1 1-deoxy-D-xylulose-5-phosphate synthase [Natranaerofaba carboxydovora]
MTEKIATRKAYGEVLLELGEKHEDIVVLDADLSKSTKTADFAKTYPGRFFNMGVSEADMMGTAAGLAASGKTAFASTFAVFAAGRAYDQIRNSICYPRQNVKIAATHSGITVGEDGASHQMLEDIALMRALPNMTVICPSDAISTKKLIKLAAKEHGPYYIRLGRPGVPVIYDDNDDIQIGKAKLLKEGNDITIIACGHQVAPALEASEKLSGEGVSCDVIDLHTIKPVDEKLILESAKKTGAVVTCEEHSIIGGLGGAVAECLSENHPVPIKKVGVNDTFGESGTGEELLKKYGLTSQDIEKKVKEAIGLKAD